MRILDFIRSMLPRLRKDQILEDLRITEGELKNSVTPAYDDAEKFFKTAKLKSKDSAEMSTTFYRNYKASRVNKQNMVLEIGSRIKNVVANLKFVSEQNEDLLERDVFKDGLTAKKAILVRSAEQLSFVSRYAIDLLNLVYLNETKEMGGAVHDLVPIQKSKLTGNVGNFAAILSIFGEEPEKFQKQFDTMPDVVINEKTFSSLAAVYTDDNLDPLHIPLVSGFESNPIYHLRLLVAEWQADRYKVYKDKKRMLELRLLNLKMLDEKNPDPKVEQEIEYIQNRIEGLEFKMKKMEEAVS